MDIDKIKNSIRTVPDYPKPGIQFKDITPILSKPKIFSEIIDQMSSFNCYKKADALIAIDARGFLFASALGIKLSKPILTALGNVTVCATFAMSTSILIVPNFPLAGKLLKASEMLPLVVTVT